MAANTPLTIVWISDFPIEWLSELPTQLQKLERRNPATWQMVLLTELEKNPALRCHVILFRGQVAADISFRRHGVTFHLLKASPKLRVASGFWLDTLRIRRLCAQIQPNVVHAWGSEKGAALIASRLAYPYVMTIQGLFAWLKQKAKLSPYVRFIEGVERISLQRAQVVTAESHFAVQFLGTHFPKPKVLQVEHAPNPVFGRVCRRPSIQPIEFVSIGSLTRLKGTDLLFAALDRLASEIDFKLKIITDTSRQVIESYRPTVSERTWRRTEFKQHLLPHEVAAELETATVLLMPTRADNSPNAVKEAVVAGVPVVAAAVGGIPDYVIPGKNGELFPAGDLEAFGRALRAACAHPRFCQGQVAPETLAQMRAYLAPELMAQKFLAAYEVALAIGR